MTRLAMRQSLHPQIKGTFGVVLHAELRGSAVALKSLRTGTRPPMAGLLPLEDGTSTQTSSTRNKGLFTFIDTAYAQVTDEHRRGQLRLQRAFMQASRQVTIEETLRRHERAK